jgi:acyl-CoA reductase-like NAD-dependent aldehyde dehydrogenase
VNIVDPATGEAFDRVLDDTPETVAAKVAAAHVAQPEWADRALAERVHILGKFRELVVRYSDDLAATLTRETGKPITQSHNELRGLLPRIDFFLDAAPRVLADETVLQDGPTIEVIAHEPLGVIANISAWNYPYFVGSNVFVPALLAGNAVLYKPSEHATLTGLAIGSMLGDAGVPIDAFATVMGPGAVGAELLTHRLDGTFFTGSYATGRRVAEAMAGQLAAVQLELGGKDPVYVCDDVDVAWAAVSLADGAFYNNGQSCCSVERIYVHRDVHDAFVDAFAQVVDGFVMGDPTDEGTYLGPLTRADQADVLEAQVADALAGGATVVRGGKRVADRPGAWFEPTVLTGVTSDMAVMRDESFGPVIGIQSVADDDEAVARMADTEYGLTAGVYTPDEVRARSILRRLDVGSAYWNCCDRVSPRLPWSGRGHSGMGTTLSTYGLLTFTRPRAWHLIAMSSGRQASRRTASPSG